MNDRKYYIFVASVIVFIVVCVICFKGQSYKNNTSKNITPNQDVNFHSEEFANKSEIELPPIKINRSKRPSMDVKSLEEIIVKIAEKRAKTVMEIPADVEPTIKETDKLFIVTWPFKVIDDVPRPDYYAQVEIDKKSKKVLNVIVP